MRGDARLTETVIRAMIPSPDAALVTTFFFGPVKNQRTFLFPPILRQEVREQQTREGDHILVYMTQPFEALPRCLAEFPRESFRLYGADDDPGLDHVECRPFSRTGFLEDLASARGVVATAGFTLLTESLFHGKPYLALPMAGQFEQELNAMLLEQLGYGKRCQQLTTDALGEFLYRLPDHRQRLADYPREDNRKLLDKLDQLLANDAAGAVRARQQHRSE